jgi:nitric oxide reductase activation protein
VPEAIRSCKREGVRVLTLGLDCDPMSVTALQEEYGDLIKFVDDVAKLPETLRSLLAARKSPPSGERKP